MNRPPPPPPLRADTGSGARMAAAAARASTRLRVAGTVAAVLLCAALAWLVVDARTPGFDFNRSGRVLRDIKQLDARWHADVLNAVLSQSGNYDLVTAPLPRVRLLDAELQRIVDAYARSLPEHATRMPVLVDRYRRAMSDRIRLIERIKSQHAVLSNSSRFLPVAGSEARTAVRLAHRTDLEATLNPMLADAMSFLVTPDEGLERRIRDASTELRAAALGTRRDTADSIDIVLAHADVLIRSRRDGARLFAELDTPAVEQALTDLEEAFAAGQRYTAAAQRQHRHLVLAYAALLLGLLAYAAIALYRSFDLLSRSNVTLQSENDEAQLLLIQSAKMSAIGQMVAGIAHEVNTPLAYVKATFSVLQEQLTSASREARDARQLGERLNQTPAPTSPSASAQAADGAAEPGMAPLAADPQAAPAPGGATLMSDIESLLDDGMHGIEQISRLIVTLKNFSRIDRARGSDFAVQDGLDSALEITRYLLRDTVRVVKDYRPVPLVRCAPSQINQVFLNIITNAVQAMPERPDKGVITLRTRSPDVNTVRIEISDNGTGMTPDVQARIFDPFFTTKPVGQGTGTGLSICYRIVANHGGRILVDSAPGVGTTFTIVLPVSGDSSDTTATPTAAPTSAPAPARRGALA